MNPRMWALGATILLASALGAVGVMTVRSASSEQAAVATDKTNVKKADEARAGTARVETCGRLARKITGRDLTDAQLDRVVKRHEACQAVVVDSVDGGSASSSGTSGGTLVTASTEGAVLSSDDGPDDDFDEGDRDFSGHEGSDDDGDDDDGDDDDDDDDGDDD